MEKEGKGLNKELTKNDENLLDWARKKQDMVGKLTPIELKNREFSKKLKGYDVHEVNEFITEVYENYKDLFRENSLLSENIARLSEEVNRFKEMEEKMNAAIMNAQTMGEDLRSRAEKEAGETLEAAKNKAAEISTAAESEAGKIISGANNQKERTLKELEDMKSNYLSEVNRLKNYRDQLLKELKGFFQKKAGELQKIVKEIKSEIKDKGDAPGEEKTDQES